MNILYHSYGSEYLSKASGQNHGHEKVLTTFYSYGVV